MPALRVACYDCSIYNKRETGSRCNTSSSTRLLFRWIADDDLRGIAKYSILLRSIQFVILIPTLVVLIQTYNNAQDFFDSITTTTAHTAAAIWPCRVLRISTIIWFFWSSSLFTVVISIVLEIIM